MFVSFVTETENIFFQLQPRNKNKEQLTYINKYIYVKKIVTFTSFTRSSIPLGLLRKGSSH